MTRADTPLWLARVGPPLLLAATLSAGVASLYGGHPQGALAYADAEPWRLAPAEPGLLADLKVRPGDRVAAGDVIALLEPSALDAELRVLEAQLALYEAQATADVHAAATEADAIAVQLAEAEADLAEARATEAAVGRKVATFEGWAAQGLGGAEDRAAAEADRSTAAASARALTATVDALRRALTRARGGARAEAPGPATATRERDVVAAEIAALHLRRDALTLRAPGEGRVTAVHARPGAGVGPDLPLVEIAPETTDRVVACLIEREAGQVAPGQRAAIWPLDGSERRDATVTALSSRWHAPDPRCRTIVTRDEFVLPVYLQLAPDAPGLPAGLRATVRFEPPAVGRAP